MRTVPGFVVYKGDTGAGRPQIARGAEGVIYSSNDKGLSTPLAVRDIVTEEVVANPVSNLDGFVEPFKVSISDSAEGVFWVSGGYPIFQPFLGRNGRDGADGIDGVDGSNVVPTEAAVKTIMGVGSEGDGIPDASTSSKLVAGGTATNLATNPAFRGVAGAATTPRGTAVMVGSFNMRLSSMSDPGDRAWSARRTPFADQVIASGASIVGLQEVSYVTDPATSQANELVSTMNTILGSQKWSALGATDGANAIAWDDTVLARETDPRTVYVNRLNTEGQPRTMVWAIFRVRSTSERFVMVCTHWQHDSPTVENGLARRREAADTVADRLDGIRADTGLPAVITADFNDYETGPESPRGALIARGYLSTRDLSSSAVVNDTYNSHNNWDPTMAGKMNGRWIDGIHVSTGVSVASAGLHLNFVTGTSGPLQTPLPSDHNMLYAGLALNVAPAVAQQGQGLLAVTTGGGASAYQTMLDGVPVLSVDGQGATSATGTSVYVGPAGAVGSAEQLGLTIGETYTIEVDCIIPETLGDSGSTWARAIVVTTPGVGNYPSNQAPKAAGTYHLSITFTASDKTYVRLYHGYDSGLIHWSNLMIAEGATAPPYFDGNTSGAWWGSKVEGITLAGLVAGTGLSEATALAIARAVAPHLARL
ncbi:endonuclease/exonuclease/phosphatase family protein [Arthrobacter rhombi]|uniref:endonuclease/exonuclease/phosphatase family protein n=1 Tax=Arthrobacter rhombi TaxID=71253 RepID=UPI003FD499F9